MSAYGATGADSGAREPSVLALLREIRQAFQEGPQPDEPGRSLEQHRLHRTYDAMLRLIDVLVEAFEHTDRVRFPADLTVADYERFMQQSSRIMVPGENPPREQFKVPIHWQGPVLPDALNSVQNATDEQYVRDHGFECDPALGVDPPDIALCRYRNRSGTRYCDEPRSAHARRGCEATLIVEGVAETCDFIAPHHGWAHNSRALKAIWTGEPIIVSDDEDDDQVQRDRYGVG